LSRGKCAAAATSGKHQRNDARAGVIVEFGIEQPLRLKPRRRHHLGFNRLHFSFDSRRRRLAGEKGISLRFSSTTMG
jgi:hypothetical protein